MAISSDSSFKYKCILYILPFFSIILLIIIKIILISLERSLLLGTLMHYHAYIEGSCVRLSSHWTVPPFLIQSLLTPIFVHLLFQISFLSPIGMFRKSCVIRSCLLLTVYYHSFILLSTILSNIFIFSFFNYFSYKLCMHFTKFKQSVSTSFVLKKLISLHRQHTSAKNYTIIRTCHAFTTILYVQMFGKGFIIYEQRFQNRRFTPNPG